ncbi:MAG: hypothetical protein E4H01_16875 [Lysobacterales bacterium]|nr:MAG: hypothetical protein E4H01_16875 [Xanthomonadales bacterium]
MSLYPTTSLIQSEKLQTIDELIAILKKFKTRGANHIDLAVINDDNYVGIDDALVSVELLEKVLSDGSKAYDIKLVFTELE